MAKFKHPIKQLTKQLLSDWEIEIMRKHEDKIAGCAVYPALLSLAERAFDITRDQARERYGLYTYGQWIELLEL